MKTGSKELYFQKKLDFGKKKYTALRDYLELLERRSYRVLELGKRYVELLFERDKWAMGLDFSKFLFQ